MARRGAVQSLAGIALSMALAVPPAAASPPPRVMSLNVCTDQLAMLLSAPGELISVSDLASDPSLSYLSRKAAAYPKNHGFAEEVFLAHPDIVVTGAFALTDTTALLRRLGYRVEEFGYTQTLATIPGEIRRMGRILGHARRADAMAAHFEAELAAIRKSVCGPDPTAIAYGQNGVAMGAGTLADSVMKAAGLRNIAAELGFQGVTPFPLELLVLHHPDIVILPERLSAAPSLAELAVRNPALRALKGTLAGSFVPPGAWSCGGPFVLKAVKALRAVRDKLSPCAAAGSGKTAGPAR